MRAAVYKPKNGEPQVECAVKCLKTDNQGTNERVSVCITDLMLYLRHINILQSEILREADAMAMLDHPYIVRLYGVSKDTWSVVLKCVCVCVFQELL